MAWIEFFYFLSIIGIAWLLYGYVSKQPGAFTKDSMLRSLNTLGLLALGLIAFIAFCVFSLKNG